MNGALSQESKISMEVIIMIKQAERFISIGEAARLTGVSVKRIRSWEERGYIPSQLRIDCGQRSFRQYKEADLEIISSIKSYLDDGFTLPAAANKAADENSNRKEDR
jgi:DNA-binding transcriptional MerR regulator